MIQRALLLALALTFSVPARAQEPPGETPGLSLELTPGAARPGDAVMITLRGVTPCPEVRLGDRVLSPFAIEGGCRAVVGLSVDEPPGQLPVRVGPADGSDGAPVVLGALDVQPADFNVRELTVSRRFVKPSLAQRRRMKADRRAFAQAFRQPFAPPMFKGNFDWPRRDVITAPFGDLRTFNGKKQSQHYGTDIDGRIGDPVVAANDGVVVMTRDNYAAGRTVLLYHGVDLYTAYFHLSKMEVEMGQRVKKGERIGEVGRSGRVTGPHLHWSVKIGGLYVDPLSVLRLDFTR